MSGPRRPDRLRASVLRAILPVGLLMAGCGGPDVPSTQDPIAPEDRDRESWGVRLQLHSQNTGSDTGSDTASDSSADVASVTVEAPYITDHIELQLTRADSGVTVTLADSTNDVITRLSAHRLVVDHEAHTVALAGSVQATSPARNVTLRADTLIWDRIADRLTGPAGVHVDLASGQLSAAVLAGGSDLALWSAQQVQSTFRDSASTAHEIEIVAPAAQVMSDHRGVVASFDSARVQWRDRQVRAHQVSYDGRVDELRLSGAARLEDSTRQVRADTVVVALSEGRFVARGDVRVTGDLELQAEQLTEDGDGYWSVVGEPLRLEVDGRRVRSQRLSLSAGTDTVQVMGAAWAAEGDRTIEADTITLLRTDDELRARGSVRVQASDVEGDLQADHMRIHGAGGQLLLWGRARLRRLREAADDLTLTADTLRLEAEGGGLTGTGSFVLQSPPRVTLRAHDGTYQTTSESELDTSSLAGTTDFLYEDDASSSRLSADTCQVVLATGTAVAVIWPVPLRGHLQDAEQTSWLQARSGRGELTDGRLSHLALEGDVEVTHRGEGERLSRFTASSMGLQYDDQGVLFRVQAEGEALVRTRTSGGSLNEVGGEHLEVTLKDGAVASVRVVEAIEGRFVPDDDDSQRE